MIEVSQLSRCYETDGGEIRALDGVGLVIRPAEFVLVLGPSGCGKSTLLNLLGGLDRPTHGSVLLDGEDVAHQRDDAQARVRREAIGFVFQNYNLINDMSVLDNVALPLKFSGVSPGEARRRAEMALSSVAMVDRAGSTPSRLSGGQQQRVAIARALINDPDILLCDEPTGNLDSQTGQGIMEMLRALRDAGKTVVVVTHNEAYAAYATRVVRMLDGKVTSDETSDVLASAVSPERRKARTIRLGARLRLATANLARRKLRVFLTACGVAIGAMAVVVLMAFAFGLEHGIKDQLDSTTRANDIEVSGSAAASNGATQASSLGSGTLKPLSDQTMAQLSRIHGVKLVYPEAAFSGRLSVGDGRGELFATNAPPLSDTNPTVAKSVVYGRYFTSESEPSIILPYDQAAALGYGHVADIIGQEATLGTFVNLSDASKFGSNTPLADRTVRYRVVGVFARDVKPPYGGALIPNGTAISLTKELRQAELSKAQPSLYSGLMVVASDAARVNDVKSAITAAGYGASSYSDLAGSIGRTFIVIQVVVGAIGAIALLVASLGIINTMLMSALERRREIGIMKAIGARAKDVRSVFVWEAVIIGLVGGIGGLILGYPTTLIGGFIVNRVAGQSSTGDLSMAFIIPVQLAIGIIVFSMMIAAVAGYFPARRAASLDPTTALRGE